MHACSLVDTGRERGAWFKRRGQDGDGVTRVVCVWCVHVCLGILDILKIVRTCLLFIKVW